MKLYMKDTKGERQEIDVKVDWKQYGVGIPGLPPLIPFAGVSYKPVVFFLVVIALLGVLGNL